MNNTMTSRERLEAAFSLKQPDQTPLLGGWIACPEHIMEICGVSEQEYWKDPQDISIRAYRSLGMDGLMAMFVPASRGDYRCIDHTSYAHASTNVNLEDAVAKIDTMPSPEQIESEFDFEGSYTEFRQWMQRMQLLCGDMVWMPAIWNAGAKLSWYDTFGYENFFMIIAAYPDSAQKLLEIGGAQGHCQSRLIARAVKEGLFPHAVLLGEDICTQRGPMVSIDFLEKYFAPQLRYGLEPLREVGCRPVWHCDGDVRLLLDLLIDAGVQGLQGFQPECGMLLEEIVARRTRDGEPLVIFGPLAVTTELPICSPEEIQEKVRHAIAVCKGKASLVLFTSNTINPDIPLANIKAMYSAIKP